MQFPELWEWVPFLESLSLVRLYSETNNRTLELVVR